MKEREVVIVPKQSRWRVNTKRTCPEVVRQPCVGPSTKTNRLPATGRANRCSLMMVIYFFTGTSFHYSSRSPAGFGFLFFRLFLISACVATTYSFYKAAREKCRSGLGMARATAPLVYSVGLGELVFFLGIYIDRLQKCTNI